MMGYWDNFNRYPKPSIPRPARGGIRAASQRGKFGESWWARRWIQVLESFNIGGRLQRGRSYARKGQVLSIDVRTGYVEAKVQGSRPQPYEVNIKVRPLMATEWKRLATELSRQSLFLAKLLAGEMPQDIERAFKDARLSLFPEKEKEISTSCSCPDWSNPCKHVAAVYYLIGEEFDRNPFLIFRLRGIEREAFVAMLGKGSPAKTQAAPTTKEPPPKAEPLAAKPREFWGTKQIAPNVLGDLTPAESAAALPRRLGNLQFWRGHQPLIRALEPIYQRASHRAGAMLLEESREKEASAKPKR